MKTPPCAWARSHQKNQASKKITLQAGYSVPPALNPTLAAAFGAMARLTGEVVRNAERFGRGLQPGVGLHAHLGPDARRAQPERRARLE